ncbi:MAG: class I SAM-dependent methyltransferase [Chryseobacterium sp.]|nr:class I SAM-dependent methyltransferase [Chryseobacterium sp.]
MMDIIAELKKSEKFTEGKNTSVKYCQCEKCLISRYRHTHEPNLSDPNHSYWQYLKFCIEQADTNGIWLEFGVGSGKSISFIAKQNEKTKIYGFDSFFGLPEDWIFSNNKVYKKDSYSRNGLAPNINQENIELIIGLFNETLPEFCSKNKNRASLIHIDCDLYSSTKDVLDILYSHSMIKSGTIILFDEFYNYQNYENYEYKAFTEFIKETRINYEWIAHTESFVDWNGNQAALRVL